MKSPQPCLAIVIRACSVCGDVRLRMPGLSDAVVPETDNLADFVCAYGHKMTPMEFDSQADYEAFANSLA